MQAIIMLKKSKTMFLLLCKDTKLSFCINKDAKLAKNGVAFSCKRVYNNPN